MTSGASVGAEVARVYDDTSELGAELAGGSLHMGYWESPSDRSTMAEASLRLTDLMTEKIQVGPGDRVLDVGCGTGAPAIRLAQSTGAAVVGITNSPVQYQLAVQNAQDAGVSDRVTFRCEDAMDLDLPARSFDAVWLIESISHMPDRLAALRKAVGVLKPGGRLALTDILDPNEHASPPGHSPVMARPVRLADYESLLERAGLVPVEMADISNHTVARTLACMRQKLTDDREHLVRRFGSRLVEQVETAILPMMESAGWGYGIVVATVPAP
jgi:cyclopropane fatty-acyl-phospholipid synthase-like methyltransferase